MSKKRYYKLNLSKVFNKKQGYRAIQYIVVVYFLSIIENVGYTNNLLQESFAVITQRKLEIKILET